MWHKHFAMVILNTKTIQFSLNSRQEKKNHLSSLQACYLHQIIFIFRLSRTFMPVCITIMMWTFTLQQNNWKQNKKNLSLSMSCKCFEHKRCLELLCIFSIMQVLSLEGQDINTCGSHYHQKTFEHLYPWNYHRPSLPFHILSVRGKSFTQSIW